MRRGWGAACDHPFIGGFFLFSLLSYFARIVLFVLHGNRRLSGHTRHGLRVVF